MKKNQYTEEALLRFSRDKIHQKIEELEKGGRVEEYKKRWLWELTQNAKDCAKSNEGISINIMIQDKTISFSHDGYPFDYTSVMDLVLQNSSKRKEDNKTGKFGTGFISTHLISKKVRVTGSYVDNNNNVRNGLDIDVDRNFSNMEELEGKLKNTIEKIDNIFSNQNNGNIYDSICETKFNYEFENTDSDLIKDSIKEFYKMAPFVLAFNKEIKRITLIINKKKYVIEVIERVKCNNKIEEVTIKYKKENILIRIASDEDVFVSTKLEYRDKVLHCSDVSEYPKLFCDFPMIGTENFSFPLIINSKFFDMQQERNGIYPKSDLNKRILAKSIELYEILLDNLSESGVLSLYNCCRIERSNNVFLDVYENVRDIFKRKPLILTLGNVKHSLVNTEGNIVPIPFVTENNFRLWEVVSKVFNKIPLRNENLYWLKVCPENKWSFKEWAYYFQNNNTELNFLKGNPHLIQEDTIELLNNFYECWIHQEGKQDFIQFAPILLQNGQFTKLNKDKGNYAAEARDLFFDNGIDEGIKDVYNAFFTDKDEPDIRSNLVDNRIRNFDSVFDRVYSTKNLADKISEEVRKLLSEEQVKNEKRQEKVQKKYNMLTDWFNGHRDLAKELFSDLYEKSYNLTNHEEMTRRLHNGDLYEEITKDIDKTPEEIRQILQSANTGNLNLNQYTHNTVHSIYSAEKYQSLRRRSIKNVFFKLKEKRDIYIIPDDLSEWEKSTDNVFQAKKIINDREIDIRIVVRPADDNKIIFYEQVELEAMDELSYELWIDDGDGMVKSISLAELIVMTGINMIPLNLSVKEND
mgnify:CR=1 FL=1